MADQLFLSYKLNGFSAANMHRHYEKMLRLFPYSRLAQSPSTFRMLPLTYAEPPVVEEALAMPQQLDRILAAAKEFQSDDTCCRLETSWDLWQYIDGDWKLAPARAALSCFGPRFEDAEDHLEVEFGREDVFLPQPDLPGGLQMAQSNIRSLLKLVHDLDNALNVEQRRLWSESGENFAARLQQSLLESV